MQLLYVHQVCMLKTWLPPQWNSCTQERTCIHTRSETHRRIQKEMWRECRGPRWERQPSKRTTCLSLGVSEPWLVVFHATTSHGASRCPQPIQDFNNSLHSPKVPAGFHSSLPSTLWRGFEPVKAKTMYNGPSSTTHDPVMKREEYGWRGWWEEKKGRGEGWMCRNLVCVKWGGGIRCGVHANHIPLFSSTGVRDSLTKKQQMDEAGLRSPQKKRAVMKTTFFHTKTLCSHGHAWLHVRWRPSMFLCCTQSHTPARAQLVYCLGLIQLFLTVRAHPLALPPCLSLRGYLHTFRPTHTFFSLNFGKCEAYAKWFTLTLNAGPLSKASVISFSSESHVLSTQQSL